MSRFSPVYSAIAPKPVNESSLGQPLPRVDHLQRDDLYKIEKPYITTFDTSALGGPNSNFKFTKREIDAQITEPDQHNFDLDVHGFNFLQSPTTLQPADFHSEVLVTNKYYSEVINLARSIRPKAKHIEILSYVRRDCSDVGNQTNPSQLYGPASHAHADTTPSFAKSLLKRYLERQPSHEEISCEILNVWRVTHGPTRNWPLAMCDFQSLAVPEDIETADVVHPSYVGEETLLYWNHRHRWYFLENQRREDVIVFRQADSRGIHIPFAVHASFENSSEGNEPQKTIEVRLACFNEV